MGHGVMSPNEAVTILLDPESTKDQIKEVEEWVEAQEVLIGKVARRSK